VEREKSCITLTGDLHAKKKKLSGGGMYERSRGGVDAGPFASFFHIK